MTLAARADAILRTAAPAEKVRLSAALAADWRAGRIAEIGRADPPPRPARPDRPELLSFKSVPRRGQSAAGRIALMHAIAHIELNAIDLAWDLVARFPDQPRALYDDFVGVAADEARHFAMLEAWLTARGSHYGAMPAHDGLWEAAEATADDLLARLAVVPLVLEARGLDTVPDAVRRLTDAGESDAAAILAQIGEEEVPHVAAGMRWFRHLCAARGLDPVATFHEMVRTRYRGQLKAPFAEAARAKAGFAEAFYLPLQSGN